MILLLALALAGCCGRYLIYWDHPYCGVVLDEDTGEPIAGAVVAASYYVEHAGFETTTSHLTCKETVTDEQGRFRIPRMVSARPWFIISCLAKEPQTVALKVGYSAIDYGPSQCRKCCSEGGLVFRMHRYRSSRWDNLGVTLRNFQDCPKVIEMENKARIAAGLEPF